MYAGVILSRKAGKPHSDITSHHILMEKRESESKAETDSAQGKHEGCECNDLELSRRAICSRTVSTVKETRNDIFSISQNQNPSGRREKIQ